MSPNFNFFIPPNPFHPQDYLVLIVDDQVNNLRYLMESLDHQGYLTTFARSGVEALKRLESLRENSYLPGLILLDLMMPEMDGWELMERLQADADYCRIPVIFVTANNDRDVAIRAFEKGAVDYVTKPFCTQELLMRLQTHLMIQHQTHQLQENNQKWASIVEFLSDGLLILDNSGVIQFVNRAAVNLMGHKKNTDLIGQTLGIPLNTENVMSVEILRPNGQVGLGEITCARLYDREGEPFIVSLRDVTPLVWEQRRQQGDGEEMQSLLGNAATLDCFQMKADVDDSTVT